VKENDILNNYLTSDGNIIDGNGEYSNILLYERGYKFDIKIGKIFPIIGPNKNSGLLATLGFGFIQHKIKIDTPNNSIPYLEGEYSKGYDRLCNGFALTEFLGYMHFSNKRMVNLYGGLECTQGLHKKQERN
jgi:hypothetical protein